MISNKLTVLVFGLSFFAAAAVHAEPASKQENIGVGVGTVVGTLAGGPVGFFVGAASGALIGDRMHQSEEKTLQLSESLVSANEQMHSLQTEVDGLTMDIVALGGELAEYESGPAVSALELLRTGIEMDVLFRTDEDAAGADASARIGELARFLAMVPGVIVELDGYADPRGEASYNQSLSVRRAETIREIMLGAGMNSGQIQVIGHGATAGEEVVTDIDGLAFERRVTVRFFVDSTQESDGKLAGL